MCILFLIFHWKEKYLNVNAEKWRLFSPYFWFKIHFILWKTIYASFEPTHAENIMMVYINRRREFIGLLIINWITEDPSNQNKTKNTTLQLSLIRVWKLFSLWFVFINTIQKVILSLEEHVISRPNIISGTYSLNVIWLEGVVA